MQYLIKIVHICVFLKWVEIIQTSSSPRAYIYKKGTHTHTKFMYLGLTVFLVNASLTSSWIHSLLCFMGYLRDSCQTIFQPISCNKSCMHNLLSETIMSDLSTRTLIPISRKKPQLSSISVIKSLSSNLQKHVISRNIYLSLCHLIHQNPF